MFEFACVAEIFGLPRPEVGDGWYAFETFSVDGNPVKTQYHGEMVPDKSLAQLEVPNTLIIPGWSGNDVEPPATLIKALVSAHEQGCRLLSICSGVFVLAATELLNGKAATTHWKYINQLSSKYPEIHVKSDVLYVDNGSILTSAGSAAGLDLCLHLVRKDFGSEIVNSVARRLVIPPLREGNQAQFVEQPVPVNARSSISEVLETMRKNLSQTLSVAEMAASINTSERTFLRRFKEATGTTPGNWLAEARIQYARELLERTTLPMEVLAAKSGFGTATTLRHHFRNRLNVSPVAYRKMFRALEMDQD